jgi:ABC-2 type transport system permease protein
MTGSPAGPGPSGSGFGRRTLPNILAVARREFTARARTRAYRWTTVVLVVAGVALACAPSLLTALTQSEGGKDRIEVIVGDSNPSVDVVTALQQILNAASQTSTGIPVNGTDVSPTAYTVVASTDLELARSHVLDGSSIGALLLGRRGGDLTFQLYSNDTMLTRRVQLIQQAAISIAIQDRLTRAGIPPIDQARLFATPEFSLTAADPNAREKPGSSLESGTTFLVTFGLSIAIFMAVILYGQWIAFSVVEEKSSRVMEIVLAAATPFQLLAGKVLGVGALAILQYVIVIVPTGLAVVFQGQIAALILGGSASSVAVPEGLSLGMLATFGVMFVLGFGLYATLYAGAAALVSRQEDLNSIIAPLSFISVAGYLVATYSASGLIPIDSPFVVVLSFIPFFSPYLMLIRLGVGAAGPMEVAAAIVLLVVTIPAALWLAARLYRSGVLMYGQRPSPAIFLRALRAR